MQLICNGPRYTAELDVNAIVLVRYLTDWFNIISATQANIAAVDKIHGERKIKEVEKRIELERRNWGLLKQ